MRHELPRVAQTLDYSCGAACFESMVRHLRGSSPGELYFAERLGTLTLGYTPPEKIVELARAHGFTCEMVTGAEIPELFAQFRENGVLFVTWWDEDAGHYSLVKDLDADAITLMDPWLARENEDRRIDLPEFEIHWKRRGARVIRVAAPSEADSTNPGPGV